MCPLCGGEEELLIGFKYGQDKQMITGQLILILGDKQEEVKGKEESIFTNGLSHLGLTRNNSIIPLRGMHGTAFKVGTNRQIWGLAGALPLPYSISGIST